MTAPEQTRPTAEHTDAVAVEFEHVVVGSGYYAMNIGTSAANESARAILTSSNPETHEALAANLPADVMLDALVRAGVLTVEDAPIYRAAEHHHWQQRWDGEHTHEGRRHVTPWEVAP